MPQRWCAITVTGEHAVCVDVDVDDGEVTIRADHTWRLQKGDRPEAYSILHEQIAGYLQEHGISRVMVKASATSGRGMGKGHLLAAEVRGVVLAAAASKAKVSVVSKSAITKGFGNRGANDYINDDTFWSERVEGNLRKGSRQAALMILAEIGQ